MSAEIMAALVALQSQNDALQGLVSDLVQQVADLRADVGAVADLAQEIMQTIDAAAE
jgi:hypothetical protein